MVLRKLRVGTRGSALALRQADIVSDMLDRQHPGLEVEVCVIRTKGDRVLDVPLAQIGDKGLFVKELEIALLNGEVDFAVHSMKDLPSEMPEGLCIAAVPEREYPGDVLISGGHILDDLPVNAVVGCGSVRRQALLGYHRRDLRFVDIRGNIDTRLRKLDEGEFDAIVLAYAGIHRLGLDDRITERIPFDICLPAVGQGALGVQARVGDDDVLAALSVLNHPESMIAVDAERSLMRVLGGGCSVPFGALAFVDGDVLTLHGVLASSDGGRIVRGKVVGSTIDIESVGRELADVLLADGCSSA